MLHQRREKRLKRLSPIGRRWIAFLSRKWVFSSYPGCQISEVNLERYANWRGLLMGGYSGKIVNFVEESHPVDLANVLDYSRLALSWRALKNHRWYIGL